MRERGVILEYSRIHSSESGLLQNILPVTSVRDTTRARRGEGIHLHGVALAAQLQSLDRAHRLRAPLLIAHTARRCAMLWRTII